VIEIAALAGLVTVQDGGRPGRMHEGIPPGGAFVPELLAAANLALANPAGAAALEIFGTLRVRALAPARVSLDGAAPVTLAPGDGFDVPAGPWRVRYLAVAGGIDVPVVLGGRGTLLVAGLGGHEGRALRRGDRLNIGTSVDSSPQSHVRIPALDADSHIALVPGPDLERFPPDALAQVTATPLRIGVVGDRVGIRLAGPSEPAWRPRPAAASLSTPMCRGAIQVTPSGELIVLGPDGPTTGGYPLLAVVVSHQIGILLARRPHSLVRFTPTLVA
jgi:5-oxoprolinase (ATP-hydrolysing) subunit C